MATVVDGSGRLEVARNVWVTVYTASTGGVVADLLAVAGGAPVSAGRVGTDAFGMIGAFSGPDDGSSVLWGDAGSGDRVRMDTTDLPGRVTTLEAETSGEALQSALTAEISRAEAAEALLVPQTRTVNGHPLTGNVTVTASDVGAAAAAPVQSVAGKTGVVSLVKGDVGLSSVDNTSDAAKPISTATAAALAAKADLVGGLVPTSQIPALAISDTFTAASQAAMLALTAQRGDVAIRTDLNPQRAYMLTADDPTVLGNWLLISDPTAAVTSVNGQTGVAVLAKGDVGLGNVDNTSDANKPVSTAQATADSAVLTSAHTYADAAVSTQHVADNGTYLPLTAGAMVAPTVIAFGDSITALDVAPGATVPTGNVRGYLTWALTLLGNRRPHVIRNAGVGGNTTAQMLARVQTDVIAYAPGWSVVLGGANDATNDIAAATTIANLKAIYAALHAAGIRVVACTLSPTDFASTAARLAALYAVNDWIRAYSRATPGVVLCDWHAQLVLPATGLCVASYFQGSAGSRVHPTCDGAAVMGRVLADSWRPALAPVRAYLGSNADLANMPTNGMFQGTSGTITGGSGITGSVATGWTGFTGDGAAAICAASVVASTDGAQANWQQLKIGPGNGTREVHVTGSSTNGFGTAFGIGDTCCVQVEMDADNDWVSAVGVTCIVYFGAGSAGVDAGTLMRSTSYEPATFNPCYDQAVNYTGPVLLRGADFVVPTGSDRALIQLGLAADTGTIRFRRAELRKVSTV